MGDYPGLSRWALNVITSVLITEAEGNVTRREGDAVLEPRGCSDVRKGLQAEGCRQPLEPEKARTQILPWSLQKEPPAGTLTPALPRETDCELLTSRAVREQICVALSL